MKKTLVVTLAVGLTSLLSVGSAPSARAQSPGAPSLGPAGGSPGVTGTMVRRLLQDEIQDLPADHSALFSASQEVSIALEIPSSGDLAALQDALVTVVRPNGEVTEVRPDVNGLVNLEQVDEGLHAVVLNSPQVHGAKLFYFNEATEAEVEATPEPRMTMLGIRGEQLRPFVEQLRGVDGSLDDLQSDLEIGPEFGYRVALDEDGTMRGQVLPLGDRSSDASVEGTRIAIFFRGIQVAETTSDAGGEFVIRSMRPGVHGLVAAGPRGYAAFAFEAIDPSTQVALESSDTRLVARMVPPAQKVPVVLIPPSMICEVVAAMERYYGFTDGLPVAGEPVGTPVGGFMSPSGTGFGGGGGGGGGGFGLEGLAALVGLGAVAAATSDDNDAIVLPPTASPAVPGSEFLGFGAR